MDDPLRAALAEEPAAERAIEGADEVPTSRGGAEGDAQPTTEPTSSSAADDSSTVDQAASRVTDQDGPTTGKTSAAVLSTEGGQSQANPPTSTQPPNPTPTDTDTATPPKQTAPSSYTTSSTPADPTLSLASSALLPAPYPEPTPRALALPYRAAFKPKPKGILKPPTVHQARFNFRRDVLNPFNARLSVAAYGQPAAGPGAGPGANQGGTEAGPSGVGATPAPVAGGGAVGGAAAGLVQGTAAAAAAAGGFWGSALKKLSGVGVPLPAQQGGPVAQRDLSDDGPAAPPKDTPIMTASTASSSSPPSNAPSSPTSDRRHPHHPSTSSLDGPAPHTPTKSQPSSSSISASPYATIKATLSPVIQGNAAKSDPPPPPPLDVRELRKVRFRVASLKVVYPINGPNGPLAPWQEGETRRKVNAEFRKAREAQVAGGGESKGWTGEGLGRLYAESCRQRDEPGIERVKRAFRANPKTPPRVLDLSNELLSLSAVEALSDILAIDFGLKKLVLESCGLDDDTLKPILHALLVSASVPTLSLANNRRIRQRGWKFVAVFVRKAKFLRYLDVSEMGIGRKEAELLVQALARKEASPRMGEARELVGLDESASRLGKRAEDEKEAPPQPSDQGTGLGLDLNGESQAASSDDEDDLLPIFTSAPLLSDSHPDTPAGGVLSIRFENCNLKGQALEALAHGVRASSLKHISLRRNKINAMGAVALAVMIKDYAVAPDGSGPRDSPRVEVPNPFLVNGIGLGGSVNGTEEVRAREAVEREKERWQNSEARAKLRKQIEELPRTGSLLTLDVKGNDIRNGVVYISQVLKRNRTLKVLNLSENRIDVAGLVSIAEALKYNATLETLDLSLNSCCGPSLEGLATLRAAFTIHPNLKRVFLNQTHLSSEGAIALAEFLPECGSLLHLDLTGNSAGPTNPGGIDIAGVMALAVALRQNNKLRCLDLDIPPNDPDFARLSQEILQCCVRNTESAQDEAEAEADGGKKGKKVAAPILKSAVALAFQRQQELAAQAEASREARAREQEARRARVGLGREQEEQILAAAGECAALLGELVKVAEGGGATDGEVVKDALVAAQLAEAQLAEAVAAAPGEQGEEPSRAAALAEQLSALLDRSKAVFDENGAARPTSLPALPTEATNFALGSEDDASDAEHASQDEGAVESASEDEGDNLAAPLSPVGTQSRKFTEEEGEVFRKGGVVMGDVGGEDGIGGEGLEEVSGEVLRQEILDTPVKRSPRPSFSEPVEGPVA